MDGLEQQYGAQISFERVNYLSERGQALARRYQVRAHPMVIVLDAAGAPLLATPGTPTRAQISAAIERALASP